jgi:hypothetical protein
MNIKQAGSIMYIAKDIFMYVCPTTGVSTVLTCLGPVKDYSQKYFTSLPAKLSANFNCPHRQCYNKSYKKTKLKHTYGIVIKAADIYAYFLR